MAITSTASIECPHCNCGIYPDGPSRFRCGSRVDGTERSSTCEASEMRLRDSPNWLRKDAKRLQARVDELEANQLALCDMLDGEYRDQPEFVEDDPMPDWVSVAQCLKEAESEAEEREASDAPTTPGATPCGRPTN